MKLAWPLAAAVASVLIVVIAWTLLSMGLPSAERLGASETVDGIEVPVIGTVGDFPDPAHRHVVNVTADGRIVVEGRDLSFDELRAAFKRWSGLSSVWFNGLGEPIAGPNEPNSARFSGEHVVLRIDRSLPLAATLAVLEAVADARVFRIWMAVRNETDGAEGAIGLPTTLANGNRDMGGSLRLGLPTVTATATAGPSDGSPQRLFEVLRAMKEAQAGKFEVYLDVDRSLPTGTWLGLWDAVARADVAGLRLEWIIERPPPSFVAAVGRHINGEPTYSLSLFGIAPPPTIDRSPMPPVGRCKGPAVTFQGSNYEPHDGPTTLLTMPLSK